MTSVRGTIPIRRLSECLLLQGRWVEAAGFALES